jgi:hypothetical protein
LFLLPLLLSLFLYSYVNIFLRIANKVIDIIHSQLFFSSNLGKSIPNDHKLCMYTKLSYTYYAK